MVVDAYSPTQHHIRSGCAYPVISKYPRPTRFPLLLKRSLKPSQ